MKNRIWFLICGLLISTPFLLSGEMELTLNPGSVNLGVLSGQIGRTYVEIGNTGSEAHDYSLFLVPEGLRSVQTAYYPFDAHYKDLFTCSTGTISNVTFADDRYNKLESAVYFNGSGQYTTRDFVLQNDFSVTFWAKPETVQPMYSEGYSNAPAYTNYLIGPEWGGTSNWAGFGIALGTNGIMLIEHGHAYMPRLLCYSANLSGWHHYAVTFTNHAPKLYVDGVLVRSGISSQRAYTRLSHDIGGYVYGSYTGKLDELCTFNSPLDQAQINAVYAFNSQARYRITPQLGSIDPGSDLILMLKMIDTSLPLGAYADTLIFCQGDTLPESLLLPVNLSITDQGPLAPSSISISTLPSGDVMLQWQPVSQDTYGVPYTPVRYRIYRSSLPGSIEDYVEIGQSTEPQYIDAYDLLLPEGVKRFYLVRAE